MHDDEQELVGLEFKETSSSGAVFVSTVSFADLNEEILNMVHAMEDGITLKVEITPIFE